MAPLPPRFRVSVADSNHPRLLLADVRFAHAETAQRAFADLVRDYSRRYPLVQTEFSSDYERRVFGDSTRYILVACERV